MCSFQPFRSAPINGPPQVSFCGSWAAMPRKRSCGRKASTSIERAHRGAGLLRVTHPENLRQSISSPLSPPEPAAIDALQMAAAVRLWVDYFWPHSRAALRQIGLTERHATARRTLRWIEAKRLHEV